MPEYFPPPRHVRYTRQIHALSHREGGACVIMGNPGRRIDTPILLIPPNTLVAGLEYNFTLVGSILPSASGLANTDTITVLVQVS